MGKRYWLAAYEDSVRSRAWALSQQYGEILARTRFIEFWSLTASPLMPQIDYRVNLL